MYEYLNRGWMLSLGKGLKKSARLQTYFQNFKKVSQVMTPLLGFLVILFLFLTGCSTTSTRSGVIVIPRQAQIDEALLQECRQVAKIPKDADIETILYIMAHDRTVAEDCRLDKRALNKAVRALGGKK